MTFVIGIIIKNEHFRDLILFLFTLYFINVPFAENREF